MNRIMKLCKIWEKKLLPFIIGTLGTSIRNFGILYLNAFFASSVVNSVVEKEQLITIQGWWIPFLVILLFCLLDMLFGTIHGIITHNMMTDLRHMMIKRVLLSKLLFLGKLGEKGQLISRFNNDLDLGQSLLKYQILTPLMACFSGIGASISLLIIPGARLIALISYMLGIICFVCQNRIGILIKKYQTNLQKMKGEIAEWTVLSLEKNREIHMMGQERWIVGHLANMNEAGKKEEIRIGRLTAVNQIITNIPTICKYSFGILIGLYLYERKQISLSQVVLIAPMMSMIVSMITTIGDSLVTVQKSSVGFMRVFEILELPQEEKSQEKKNFVKQDSMIEVNDLSFSYPPNQVILDNVSFKIGKKVLVGIKGESGRGKTTLIKAMMSLFPYSGSIKIWGNEVSEMEKEEVRSAIAYCSQDKYIIRGSIYDNIMLGMNNKNDKDKIEDMLKKIDAYEWVIDKGGMDEMLSDEGKELSGGQAQMIVLARTLLADKEIMILDESLSEMDAVHQTKVIAFLKELAMKGKTIILITHSQEILQQCDQIVAL